MVDILKSVRRRLRIMLSTVCAVIVIGLLLAGAAPQTQTPFAVVVDEYLDKFAAFHPSIAAGNGLHAHDGQLEDFSAASIAAEVKWLQAMKQSLKGLDVSRLTPDERVDHRILLGIVDGWLLDLDTVRTWTRNPMIYATALSDGVHNLMTMESSPAPERIRQVTTKIRAVPALLAAARANIRQPPRVFVERAAVMFRGVADLLDKDLSLAFADVKDPALQSSLRAAAKSACVFFSSRSPSASRVAAGVSMSSSARYLASTLAVPIA